MMTNQFDKNKPDDIIFEIYDESIHQDESLAWFIAEEDLALLEKPPQSATQDARPSKTKPPAPCIESPIFSFPAAPFSFRLTDALLVQPDPTRRLLRVAAVLAILLIGSALPSIIERAHPVRVKASSAFGIPVSGTTKNARVRVLTVMAGRQETIKDISERYTGHFDSELVEEIHNLNPGLSDFKHLEDGQLIRIPLRTGTSDEH
jgi:hypothetical protein